MSDDGLTIRTAQDLTAALTGMAGRLDAVRRDSEGRDAELKQYGRRNRKLVIIDIAATVIATIATTIALLGYAKAHGAADAAAQNRHAAFVSCQATNEARAQNEQLWTYLLDLSTPKASDSPAKKAQAEKLLGELRVKINKTFAPRNCERVAAGEKS